MALTGPHYAAALTEVLPVGDALPRIHLPPAGLTALGLSSGSVALLAPADAVTSEAAAVAVFIAVQPSKLRPGEIAANAPALDSLRACGHTVGIGTPLRVHSGSTSEQLHAACAVVTLRLLPAPQPEPAQQSSAACDTTTGELEDALRRTTLSTPPSSSKGKARDRGASTPTAAASPAAARQQSGTGSRVSALSVAWIRRAMDDSGSLQLLEALACRHMSGRPIVIGSIMPLSLLGRAVHAVVADAEPQGGQRSAQTGAVFVCTASVRVRLVAWDAQDDAHTSASWQLLPTSAEDATREEVQQHAARDALSRARARAATQHGECRGFADLAGVPDAVAALNRLIVLPLTRLQLFQSSGLRPPRGVLLHGPPGCGKTRLAMAAAAQARVLLFVISGPELNSEYSGEAEARLRGVFQAAQEAAAGEPQVPGLRPGAVVLIDEIDALAPARGDTAGGMSSSASVRCVTQLLTLLDGGQAGVPLEGVSVIASTNRVEALDPALRRPGRFDAEVNVRAPGAAGRAAILEAKLKGVKHGVTAGQVAGIASSLHGYTGADIESLVAEAAMRALRRSICSTETAVSPVTAEDLEVAQRVIRPSIMRDVRVEVPPSACWDDVAGLESVKMRLAECLGAHAQALDRLGVQPPRGVLLFGPPGCAKTTLARAVAARGGWNFISVSGSDLFSQWVGESEKAVAALFARAREAAPCVLFLDELDALAPVRGAGGDSTAGSSPVDRVLAQLLIELDGGAGSPGAGAGNGIMLLAATNRPDLVDPALLRPGRLDRLIYVPPPASAPDREAVLRVHLRRTPISGDVDLAAIAQATPGFTGADLAGVCREACLAALTEDLDAPCVCARHLDTAIRTVRPSEPSSPEMEALYTKMARG